LPRVEGKILSFSSLDKAGLIHVHERRNTVLLQVVRRAALLAKELA
jgi:hypothetical protein